MNQEEQIVKALLKWHQKNRRSFPWRDESDPYKVLIAEFFLQRTPAERVAKIYPEFIEKYPDPFTLASADCFELIKEYKTLGLKKRMFWLVDSMKIVCEKFNGKIPDSKNFLKILPGIGEYTASAILCFAFNKTVEIVDANVIRIYSRIFKISKKDILLLAKKIIPKNNTLRFNESLLDFSALICKKNSKCYICPISRFCKKINEN